MNQNTKLSAYMIGGDTLLTECARLYLEQGHELRGIITNTPRIRAWAEERGIPVFGVKSDYKAELAKQPFDYLFAITHLAVLPADVVALPQRGAINFHDGPLPRYAGLNAPAWALMNREREYAITWHRIEVEIDTGAILLQRPVEIAPEETSLSINTKCFQAGIDSFAELLTQLAAGPVEGRPQAGERSYFGRHDRPSAAVVLDFQRSAEELEALTRALDFGPYPNPLGTPKVWGKDAVLVVGRAELRDRAEAASAAPGTVLTIDERELVVATAQGAVGLTGLTCLQGGPLSGPEAAARLGVRAGEQLPLLSEAELARLTELNAQLARAETFWSERLRQFEPLHFPLASAEEPSATKTYGSLPLGVPSEFAARFGSSTDALVAAVGAWLGRVGQKRAFDVALTDPNLRSLAAGAERLVSPLASLRFDVPADASFGLVHDRVAASLAELRKRGTWLHDLVLRVPELRARAGSLQHDAKAITLVVSDGSAPAAAEVGSLLTFVIEPSGGQVFFDDKRIPRELLASALGGFSAFLGDLAAGPEVRVAQASLIERADESRMQAYNRTPADYPRERCVHQLFEEQVQRTPDAVALVCEGRELTYRQLNARANQLAAHLRQLGVGPDRLVGVHVERSMELVIAALATQKAGGAYVPLDPAYPKDRIAFMVEDADVAVLITEDRSAGSLAAERAKVVRIDADWPEIAKQPTDNPVSGVQPQHLAYVIYTSGSTGKPKGVMVEHRNVVNFFTGMDARIAHDPPGTWLAVTSLSFDISVLELFWTLSRGFKVVVFVDRDRAAAGQRPKSQRPIEFGLFYWGNDDGQGPKKYEVLLEGAKFADANGFASVWTPERHFHAFGGPYPNPAVTSAALAAVTKNLKIRAGSCVVPLHHPIRIAEEWAVVDNLSNGRVGLSIASGWQPDDFVLRPENAPPMNKGGMVRDIEIVRRLWRGEAVEFENAGGKKVAVLTQPRPVQPELPVWFTTAGNPDSYRQAAKLGANVLTHLLGQSLSEVADKIRIYRDALEESGRPRDSGKVTLMLHTFVGSDREQVRATVRGPMKEYLRSATALIKQYAWAFPAFKRPEGVNDPLNVDLSTLTEEELDGILEFAFERYFEDSGLFGTVEECLERVEELKEIGVDEVGCLIDYGVPTPQVLEMLRPLAEVVKRANTTPAEQPRATEDYSFAALVRRHQVTHLQCTPSMARMLTTHHEAREALKTVQHVMVGGEAFPLALAEDLKSLVGATVTNMYGPTETTIWSSTYRIEQVGKTIPIGTPIANTQLYILDAERQPLPFGVAGELYIAGDGVVRGYLGRPELTAERFVADPFAGGGARMYRTGDLAKLMPDGLVEFLGRTDHQVKVRGYRIELGEIEALLGKHPKVREGVVMAREDTPGDQRLVAYLVAKDSAPEANELREHLRQDLPEYMVPSNFVVMKALPLTPNGKVDRKQLPPPEQLEQRAKAEFVAPASQLEQTVARIWQQILGRDRIGLDDNFFDLGGHSLLVVRMHRELRGVLEKPLSLTDLYRFPTIRSFTTYFSSDSGSDALEKSADRAQRRREAMQQRRVRPTH